MAQNSALIVLDDQRTQGKIFGRVKNRKERGTADEATVQTEDVELLTEIRQLRTRAQRAEVQRQRTIRRAQQAQKAYETKLCNIAGAVSVGALAVIGMVCIGADAAWLALIPAAAAAVVAKIAGWW